MLKPEKKIQNQQFMRKYAHKFIISIKRALVPWQTINLVTEKLVALDFLINHYKCMPKMETKV